MLEVRKRENIRENKTIKGIFNGTGKYKLSFDSLDDSLFNLLDESEFDKVIDIDTGIVNTNDKKVKNLIDEELNNLKSQNIDVISTKINSAGEFEGIINISENKPILYNKLALHIKPYSELENIPNELKKLKNWVFIDKQKNNPCDIRGYNISYKLAKNRGTFYELEQIKLKYNLNHNFGLYLNSEFVCIDVDKCFENKKTNMYSWAKDLLKGLNTKDNFTEYSRSGYGLHIFAKMSNELKATILKNSKKKNISVKIVEVHEKYSEVPKKCGIELFTDRVITITGDVLLNKKGKHCIYDKMLFADDSIINTYNQIIDLQKRKVSKAQKTINDTLKNSSDIFNVIKTRVTLEELFNYYGIEYNSGGNIKCPLETLNHSNDDNNPSFSINISNDTWYCHTCKVGGSIIDFVMNKEGLNEIDSAKFINEKLKLNLTFHNKFFTEEKKAKYRDEFVQQVIKQGAIIPDDMTALPWIEEKEDARGNITHDINTGILADFLRGNIDYIFARSSANDAIHRFYYNNGYYNLINDDEFKGYLKKYMPLSERKPKHFNDTLQELYTDHKFKKNSQLNPAKYINFKNGLYCLETKEIKEHSPNVFSTIQIPTDYNVNMIINKNVFDNYLDYLVDGNEELKKLILQFTGVTLSNVPGYLMKQALFMVGVHNTGKSKIKELLGMLLGEENINYTTLKELESTYGGGGIYNKRLIGSNDEPFITLKGLNFVKQIVAGDNVRVQDKYIRGFNLKFTGVIWICCNELPKFGGDKDDGVYDRLVIVRTNNKSIPPEKRDKKLLEKMYNEKTHIINLALKGLDQVIDNEYNYDIPEICKKELEEYKTENDYFLTFMKECTEPIKDKSQELIEKSKFFHIYKRWCQINNIKFTDKKKEVKQKLEKKRLSDTIKDSRGIYRYSRFTLNEEARQDYFDELMF